MNETNFLVIDTETTHMVGEEVPAQAIEVAYLDVNFEKMEVVNEFQQYYKPTIPISIGAKATHHILDGFLADKPEYDFIVYKNMMFNIEQFTYLVGHNIDFDWQVLGSNEKFKRIDTLALARRILPGLDSYSQSALIYYFYPEYEARTMCKGAHSASDDVIMCLRLLNKLLELAPISVTNLEALWKFSEYCRIPVVATFGEHYGKEWKDIPVGYRNWMITKGNFDKYTVLAVKQSLGMV